MEEIKYPELVGEMAKKGEKNTAAILKEVIALIEAEPLAKIDYVKAVDGLTISQIDKVQKPMLVAIAVYIGTTRLIDNFIWD